MVARTDPRPVVALLLGSALTVGAWAGARFVRAYQVERGSLRPSAYRVAKPHGPFGRRLQEVTFPARDGRAVRGWYVPSRTGAAVVLCHGSGSDRTSMLDEARALADAGLGVLLYDSPGNGETGGAPTYGAPERGALAGALDLLSARPDVTPARIGAFGFSMGGYTVAQVAAVDPRISAVALAGAPDDLNRHTRTGYASGGPFAILGAQLAQRAAGLAVRDPQPAEVVASIAPRPLLIVAGDRDANVTPAVAQRLYAAAGAPKRLLRVAGAGHGRYSRADPGYTLQLVAFFVRALAGGGPVGT